MYIKILLFIFIFIKCSYSQQIIKNDNTGGGIPFVEVYSDNGDLIGLTSNEGVISSDLNKKINSSNSKNIIFVHFAFEKKTIALEDYKNAIYLELTTKSISLQEVVISNNFKKKYLKLKGYFRSSQINENRVQYYIDGIVEFYISNVTEKVKMKIINHRTFENRNIPQLSKRYYFLVAGVPMINDFIKFENLSKEYNLDFTEKNVVKIIDSKYKKNKGIISAENNNLNSLQLEITSYENPKIMKFLGMESHLNNYNISSVYDSSENFKVNFKDMIYFKEIREYEIKRKKKDNFTKVDAIHEFFLIDKEYTNDLGIGNFDDFYSFRSNSFYDNNYWENIPNVIYQSLPLSLETDIKSNLKENKNTYQKKQQ